MVSGTDLQAPVVSLREYLHLEVSGREALEDRGQKSHRRRESCIVLGWDVQCGDVRREGRQPGGLLVESVDRARLVPREGGADPADSVLREVVVEFLIEEHQFLA